MEKKSLLSIHFNIENKVNLESTYKQVGTALLCWEACVQTPYKCSPVSNLFCSSWTWWRQRLHQPTAAVGDDCDYVASGLVPSFCLYFFPHPTTKTISLLYKFHTLFFLISETLIFMTLAELYKAKSLLSALFGSLLRQYVLTRPLFEWKSQIDCRNNNPKTCSYQLFVL